MAGVEWVRKTNKWYHPELLEGNFWSSYTGLDDGSGSDKHAIAGDGIGDTNTPWWGSEFDKYPFIQENGWDLLYTTPRADGGGPYEGDEVALIAFDASGSSDPQNDDLEYRWDFNNDGTWDTTWSVSPFSEFTYNDDFSDFIRVEVSDGVYTTIDKAFVTINNVAPSVISGSDQVVLEDEVVYFSGIFSDPGVVDTHTIEWNFGDGTIQFGTLSPTHVYSDPGIYTVTLQVTDDDSGIGLDSLTIIVETANNPPTADAGGPYEGDEGAVITFDASASSDPENDILEYRWDFNNDGTWDTTWNVSPSSEFTWYDDFFGEAKVEVSDSEFTAIATAAVTVNNVAPSVGAGADQTGNEGETILFLGSIDDPGTADTHTILWDFGDGTTIEGLLTPSHMYSDNGEYTVTLSVTDDEGGVGTDTLVVTVLNVPPTVNAGADQTVNEDEDVFFSGGFSDPGIDDTHAIKWDFGDGTIQAGTLTPTHVYPNPGIYTITLTVTDDDGGIGIDTLIVTVLDITPPETELTIDMYYNIDDIVYITSDTKFMLSATDFSGVGNIYYTFSGSEWLEYDLPFSITGLDGVYIISFYSIDIVGNAETPQFVTVVLVNLEVNSYLTDETNLITSFDVVFTKYKSDIFNYKLVATNPGQIFYSIEVTNEWFIPIEILTISPSIPDDFILKGEMPIHVYLDGVDITENCIIEGTSITITNVPVTSSVLVYIHLDYGLKGSHYVTLDEFGMKNYIFDVNTAGSVGTPSIPGTGLVGTYSAPKSLFTHQKKTTAIAGFITDLEGNPIVNIQVELVNSYGEVIVAITDETGFYYFINIEVGEYTIQVTYNGTNYLETTTVLKDQLTEINFHGLE